MNVVKFLMFQINLDIYSDFTFLFLVDKIEIIFSNFL